MRFVKNCIGVICRGDGYPGHLRWAGTSSWWATRGREVGTRVGAACCMVLVRILGWYLLDHTDGSRRCGGLRPSSNILADGVLGRSRGAPCQLQGWVLSAAKLRAGTGPRTGAWCSDAVAMNWSSRVGLGFWMTRTIGVAVAWASLLISLTCHELFTKDRINLRPARLLTTLPSNSDECRYPFSWARVPMRHQKCDSIRKSRPFKPQ